MFAELRHRDNMTNREIAARSPINTFVPRVFELRQKGKVVEAYRRTCGVTGLRCIAWRATN